MNKIDLFEESERMNKEFIEKTLKSSLENFPDFGVNKVESKELVNPNKLKLCDSLELGKKSFKNFKNFKDDIHGTIEFSKKHLPFIDHPLFQRLRGLKQLGATHWVYIGATHTRFEHSLGVGYLAKKYLTILKDHNPSIECSGEEIFLVSVAGLCHDLGHGPFSHTFEKWMRTKKEYKHWHHEDFSIEFLEQIANESPIDFDTDEIKFMKTIIQGNPRRKEERMFLYDIVSNSKTGVDVDKFDYIVRDGKRTGFPTNFDAEFLMNATRVIDGELCFKRNYGKNIYSLFDNRSAMHLQVYGHKTTCAIENMLFDIFNAADPILKFSERPVSELKDDILSEIQLGKDPALKEAKDLIYRINTRNFYRLVRDFILPQVYDNEKVCSQLTAENLSIYSESMKPEDFVVQSFIINHGLNDKNPLSLVQFFDDWDSKSSFTLRNDEISSFLPIKYSEKRFRVYIKNPKLFTQAMVAIHTLLRTLGLQHLL